ncbi:hypothetical protein Sta7437_3165 [Stanieria cyanosphaera PCC 7437]|uniref:Integrase family protein n=2 Tax=Stanieria cyanosphaera TaxID=102116 RepID=K9XVW5_STAC7|nr:hypothetical protein Sta7437_3165 [Stanieria cyanosphaera PCC 7437]
MARKNQTIALQFKVGKSSRSQHGCNCSFTLDGMVEALSKANKVAEALKSTSETEFWQWYDREIKQIGKINNDLLTFGNAIAKVEDDFWNRPSRTRRKRDRGNSSDVSSWNSTYGRFYSLLPTNENVIWQPIARLISQYEQGSRSYQYVVMALKKLARVIKRNDLLEELENIDTTQTSFLDLQTITLEEFLRWRNEVLGITASLHPNADISTRKRWLWAFSMQVVYGLRIHEVFAIQNLDKPFTTKDKVVIPALNDLDNTDNLIVIGEFTSIGTTTKTKYRIARPMLPPKYPNLIDLLEIKSAMKCQNLSFQILTTGA